MHYLVTLSCVFNLIISGDYILVSKMYCWMAYHALCWSLWVCCVEIWTSLQIQKDSGHEICLLNVNCKYLQELVHYVTSVSVRWVPGRLSLGVKLIVHVNCKYLQELVHYVTSVSFQWVLGPLSLGVKLIVHVNCKYL